MHHQKNLAILCLTLIAVYQATLADTGTRSDETLEEVKSLENNASIEAGPPDSHEAMNNREINPKAREKRSYEFLMGLINNNSKYEVTRVDPSKPTKQGQSGASELLLELLVKIAAHPDHWDKVHKLLQKIDTDLFVSKNLVNLENSKSGIPIYKKLDNFGENGFSRDDNKNKWPSFGDKPTKDDKSKIVTYPRTFAYHKVTGKPLYANKNPKAYIAVSVIAPKPLYKEDDFALENELRQLKPWMHKKNAL